MENRTDVKNSNGKWLTRVGIGVGNGYQPRSSVLWFNLVKRLKGSGIRNETYIDCENKFKDFQIFAEWCQTEPNYRTKDEDGKFYHLDKDILFPNNKIYSPETCCFVPSKLNMVLSKGNNKANNHLIGTSKEPRSGKFIAHVAGLDYTKSGYIGIYHTEIEAHRAWQLGKIEALHNAVKDFDYLPEKVLLGINAHASLILNQYLNYETTS